MPVQDCYRKSGKVCNAEFLCNCSLSRHWSLLLLIRNNAAAEIFSTHRCSLRFAGGLARSEGAVFRLHFTSDPAGSRAVPCLPSASWTAAEHCQHQPQGTAHLCCGVPRQLEVRNLLALFLSLWVIQSQCGPNCKLLLSAGLPRYSMFKRQLQCSFCYFVSVAPCVHQGSRMCERLGVNWHWSNPGWRRYLSS